MELVWKLQILPYNHANLNSHSGSSRQVRIIEFLPDFSNHVGPQINSAQIHKQLGFEEF
jgi:hypothetical protein